MQNLCNTLQHVFTCFLCEDPFFSLNYREKLVNNTRGLAEFYAQICNLSAENVEKPLKYSVTINTLWASTQDFRNTEWKFLL